AGTDAGERIGAGGARQAHRGGGGVLLVVGMQHEDAVHRLGVDRVDLVLLARRAEHHVEEVLCIVQVVARVVERLAHIVLVGHRGDGRHLGDQADRADDAILLDVDVHVVVIEGGQATHHAAQDRHRMGIATEALEEVVDLVVDHGVVADPRLEVGVLLIVGQFAE
ncbi:hypothetical protein AOG27_20965, partial [Pseudoalteromonas lipolytica]